MAKFQKGQSGNLAGRPVGARQKLTESFIGDLHKKWQADGSAILDTVAKDDPKVIVQAMTSLMPKDVAVSVSQALPGNMQADEWALLMQMLRTVQENVPAGQAVTAELLEDLAQTTRAHFARTIPEIAKECA